MKCPHCRDSIHFEVTSSTAYAYEPEEAASMPGVDGYDIAHGFCPACSELVVLMREGKYIKEQYSDYLETVVSEEIIYPLTSTRPVEKEVPELYESDFKEAASVKSISPKASAAISRRLLQQLLREEIGVKKSSLSKEIDEFIEKKETPSYLADAVDAIRNIGNFAAHPLKDTNTGEILDVEEGEAEWLLEVIESLFDFVFVQPIRLEKRKSQLNEKLSSLGKPHMKST